MEATEVLYKEFGKPILDSGKQNWPYYRYYEEELGLGIMRQFLLFEKLIDPADIVPIKHYTNSIETSIGRVCRHTSLCAYTPGRDLKRTVNIDPGYITLAKVVLASTKNYSHRVYLRDGIYGEVTLYFKGGTFYGHEFTYQDYKEVQTVDFLVNGRNVLKRLIYTQIN